MYIVQAGGKWEEAALTKSPWLRPKQYGAFQSAKSKYVLKLFFPSQTVIIVCYVDANYDWEFIWCIGRVILMILKYTSELREMLLHPSAS